MNVSNFIRIVLSQSTINQSDNVNDSQINEIRNKLDGHVKELISNDKFLSRIDLPKLQLTADRKLEKLIEDQEFDKVADLFNKTVLNMEEKQLSQKDILTAKQGIAQAQEAPSGSKGARTTNPVTFLTDSFILTNEFPKNSKVIGVFKSKLGADVKFDKEILKKVVQSFDKRMASLGLDWRQGIKALPEEELSEADVKNFIFSGVAKDIKSLIPYQTTMEIDQPEKIAEALFETLREELTHVPGETYDKFIQQWKEQTTVKEGKDLSQIMKQKASVLSELKQTHGIVRIFQDAEKRFVNTALLAKEYDKICGTHVHPDVEAVKVLQKGHGFIQEPMVFFPLIPDSKIFSALSPFVPIDSYQRAVLRATELADSDLHGRNVAITPKMGNQVVSEITKLNDQERVDFFTSLQNFKISGKVDNDTMAQIKNISNRDFQNWIAKLAGKDSVDQMDLDDLAKVFAKLTHPDTGIHLDLILFDVDLTMPSSNEIGIKGCAPAVRNYLLASDLADRPLTDTIRAEIRERAVHLPKLEKFVQDNFTEQELQAYHERMERLIKAGEEETMTPRGLVWRAVPEYARYEQYFREHTELLPEENDNPLDTLFDLVGTKNLTQYDSDVKNANYDPDKFKTMIK